MRHLLNFLFLLVLTPTLHAATGGSGSGGGGGPGTLPMNSNQFNTNSPVSIKSAAIVTNLINSGAFTNYSMITGSPTTNILIDASSGVLFRVLLTNSSSGLLITNGLEGQELTIELYQDGTGNRTVTHVPNTGGAQTNNWQFGEDITSPITLTTNQYKKDLLKLRYEVTNLATNTSRSNWCVIGILRKYPN